MLITVTVVGVISVARYAPVLSSALSSASSLTSSPLPWHGFVTQPLSDLVAPSMHLFVAPLSLTAADVAGAVVLAIGVMTLFLDHERLLAVILLLPAPMTYLVFELLRLTSADRFMSFLLLPLMLVAAIALSRIGLSVATRGPQFATIALAVGIAFSLFALRRGESQFVSVDSVPIENWRAAASLVVPDRVVPGFKRSWSPTATTRTASASTSALRSRRSSTPLGSRRCSAVTAERSRTSTITELRRRRCRPVVLLAAER